MSLVHLGERRGGFAPDARPPAPRARTGLRRGAGRGGGRGIGTACGFKQERLSWVVDDSLPVHELVVLARERGGSVRLSAHDSPPPLHPKTRDGSFFLLDDDLTATIRHRSPHPARGLPPAARSAARRASCSSRSTRGGSAATRSSAAARGCSTSTRRSCRTSRSSATSATTGSPSSSRPCRSRTRARAAGEPLRRRRRAPALRPRRAASRRCCAATRRDRGAARARTSSLPTRAPGTPRARCGASPTRRPTRPGSRRCKEYIRARRRVPDRPLPAGGAADLGDGARDLPRAAADQPVAVPLPARARRLRADRLVARDAREARGDARLPQPDRRHDGRRRRRCGAAARLGEGPRRARDARRPRPQRPLARLPARQVQVERFLQVERFSHVTHLVSEVAGELATASAPGTSCARRSRPGTVSGAPKVRAMQIISELEGYRRGLLRRRRRLPHPRRRRSTRASRSGRCSCTTASRYLQAGGGRRRRLRPDGRAPGVPEQARRASSAAIELAESATDDAAPDRQLRLVHVQPGAPVR